VKARIEGEGSVSNTAVMILHARRDASGSGSLVCAPPSPTRRAQHFLGVVMHESA
jgi:hypothetical protein